MRQVPEDAVIGGLTALPGILGYQVLNASCLEKLDALGKIQEITE
jgi:hypothetical protein